MTEEATSGGSFDLDKLKELIELMEKHELTEVQLRNGPEQWKLRRGGHEAVVPQLAAIPAPLSAAPAPSPAAPVPAAAAPAEPVAAADSSLPAITSPIVGTFYEAPSPDDPAFVSVGSTVKPGSPVCIVEAMKVFNQIDSEIGGTIEEILVKNGDPVEAGQPLFRVRP